MPGHWVPLGEISIATKFVVADSLAGKTDIKPMSQLHAVTSMINYGFQDGQGERKQDEGVDDGSPCLCARKAGPESRHAGGS